jgi:tetratricopeptide (TPR) repeat protein
VTAVVDPDRERLEDERRQLLAAIDGLDRELDAGELDPVDHRELRDDYIRRAADVLRRLAGAAPAPDPAPAGRRRFPLAVLLAGFTLFAVAAGIALARASGERGVGELTGGVDPSSRARVAECQELGATGGDLVGSLRCFDEVLALDPENPEALAYRGWYLILAAGSLQEAGEEDAPDADAQVVELTESGMAYLDRAIGIDPDYPDPLAFRAIVADRQGRSADACADIETLLALEPPEFFVSMTSGIVERNDC